MALATKYYTSITPASGGVVVTGTPDQAQLAAIYVTVTATKGRWLQFFNQNDPPAPGDVPYLAHYQPKKAENLIVIYQQPIQFLEGLWWASSKKLDVYDPVGNNENVVLMQLHYY